MSAIILTRGDNGVNVFRSFKIFNDGNEVGKIKRNKTLVFEVSPALHVVKCRIDWVGSNELSVDTTEGSAFLEVKSKELSASYHALHSLDGENYLILTQLQN